MPVIHASHPSMKSDIDCEKSDLLLLSVFDINCAVFHYLWVILYLNEHQARQPLVPFLNLPRFKSGTSFSQSGHSTT